MLDSTLAAIKISIHAPREGCDAASIFSIHTSSEFQSTHPARGATREIPSIHPGPKISIHAPREGCDVLCTSVTYDEASGFQSTHPARGATGGCTFRAPDGYTFQSTHPARGATTGSCHFRGGLHISIHAPREGCDLRVNEEVFASPKFQSTHPARGATIYLWSRSKRGNNFNPRTPRGVRRGHVAHLRLDTIISIHAPREGCDLLGEQQGCPNMRFQSTHPARGATAVAPDVWHHRLISIHAPREGCDSRAAAASMIATNFNPRTPRGVRRVDGAWPACPMISIHAPREGCDPHK